MPGVSSSANCLAASCARRQPVGLDVGGLHRLRHVDHQHDHGAVARDPDVVRRSGHRDGEQQQRQHQQIAGRCRQPRRALGRNAFQQLHVGEPQHPPLAAPAARDVEPDQPERRRAGTGGTTSVRIRTASSGRATAKSCTSSWWDSRPASAPRRRVATNRTTSAIQSRSVRSARCGAPQRRSAAATSVAVRRGGRRRSRHSSWRRGELAVTPGLGVLQHDVADVGQLEVARVEHLDGEQVVPRRQRPQRRSQLSRPRKSEITTASPRRRGGPAQRSIGRGEIAARTPTGALGRGARWRAAAPARVCGPPRAGHAAPSARPLATPRRSGCRPRRSGG